MKVILKEDVKNIGSMGQILDVADGFARNYLVPRGLAMEANVKNVKSLEHAKRVVQDQNSGAGPFNQNREYYRRDQSKVG
jgi:large subunit ribosomal protein L9